jgi:hypothetical protein
VNIPEQNTPSEGGEAVSAATTPLAPELNPMRPEQGEMPFAMVRGEAVT